MPPSLPRKAPTCPRDHPGPPGLTAQGVVKIPGKTGGKFPITATGLYDEVFAVLHSGPFFPETTTRTIDTRKTMRRTSGLMTMFLCLVCLAGKDPAALSAAGKTSKPVVLFNGKDLSGWKWVSRAPGSKMEDVWSVQNGVLVCKGRPVGYIRTKRNDFSNYRLTLEWRWPKGSRGGNSGVLIHTSQPAALGIWPKSLEVQLAHKNAGDFWVIGTTIRVPDEKKRRKGRRFLNLTDNSEKPIGEWNRMEIIAEGNSVTVKVNGQLVNRGTNCSESKGAISLQSEGAEIHFRNIVLTPLK